MQNDPNVLRMPVQLRLSDGQTPSGNMLLSIGGQVERTLNSEALFISFEDEQGQRFIAKSAIAEVTPLKKERRAA